MTLGEIIEAMRFDLREHFVAKPYKHYAVRRKNADKQILAVYAITVDRLVKENKIPWNDVRQVKAWTKHFGDIICSRWRCGATERMSEAYDEKVKQERLCG